MNNERRKRIQSIIDQAAALQGPIAALLQDIETVKDEEKEYRDNMPESLQSGAKGAAAQAAIDALEAASDAANTLDSELDTMTSSLEESKQ